MERVGYVKKVIGDEVKLEVKRVSACGHEACSSCSGSCNVPSIFITLPNTLKAKEGDYVEIRTSGKKVLKYTFLTLMIPIFMIILGIIIGLQAFKYIGIKNYENFSFIMGLIFFVLSFLIIKKIDQKVVKEKSLKFDMIRIL